MSIIVCVFVLRGCPAALCAGFPCGLFFAALVAFAGGFEPPADTGFAVGVLFDEVGVGAVVFETGEAFGIGDCDLFTGGFGGAGFGTEDFPSGTVGFLAGGWDEPPFFGAEFDADVGAGLEESGLGLSDD